MLEAGPRALWMLQIQVHQEGGSQWFPVGQQLLCRTLHIRKEIHLTWFTDIKYPHGNLQVMFELMWGHLWLLKLTHELILTGPTYSTHSTDSYNFPRHHSQSCLHDLPLDLSVE